MKGHKLQKLVLCLARVRCSKNMPKERKRGTHPLSKIIVKYTYLSVCAFLFCILQSTSLDTFPVAQHDAGDLGSVSHEEDPLEKRMATHSSILSWRVPWTEEPGGLQSAGHKQLDTVEQLTRTHFLDTISFDSLKSLLKQNKLFQ